MRLTFAPSFARSLAPCVVSGLLLACSSTSENGPAPGADSATTTPDTATGTDSATDSASSDSPAKTDTSTPADATGIDGAPSGDTWDSFAKGFFAKYCVECHAGGPRDYRTPGDVARDMALIRCGVASTTQSGCTASDPRAKQFPINNSTGTNPKPTNAERDRLIAWLAAGAP